MTTDRRYQVFISSTFRDLIEERQAVLLGVLELEHIPVGMELFPAANEDAWRLIRRVIDSSDYYILIIGGRYGSVDETGISYTEKEYDYAVSSNKPVIPILHENPVSLPRAKTDTDDNIWNKLLNFRKKVEKKHTCSYWKTKDELKNRVFQGLISSIEKYPGTGWVRAQKLLSNSKHDFHGPVTETGAGTEILKINECDRKILLNLGLEVSSFNEKDEISLWGRLLNKKELGKFTPQLNLSGVPFNETWAQWISGLLEITENPEIGYFNFGDYYFFYDIISCERIEIPTGTKANDIKIKETVKPGMILFLMEK